jgi:hypothetical protein
MIMGRPENATIGTPPSAASTVDGHEATDPQDAGPAAAASNVSSSMKVTIH